MVLKYHLSPSAIDEDFRVYIYEASNTALGAHVAMQLVAKGPGPGHPNPATLTFNGLDKVVHVVRMYSVDSNALLHDFNAEPKVDLVTVFQPIQFRIGDGQPNTPAAGQALCTRPELIGLTTLDFLIFRNGYGMLHPGTHYSFTPGTGEIELIQPGDVFSGDPAEEFTIIQLPRTVTTVVNDSVVGKWFGGFVDVAANTIYDAAHLRKLVRLSGSPDYDFTIAPPIGYGYAFTHFGADGTATLKFTVKPLKWLDGTTRADMPLKNGEECMVVFDGDFFWVVYLCQSKFVDGVAVAPGTILGTGRVALGDIPPGDPAIAVVHGLGIAGDYNVFLSWLTTAGNYGADNKVTAAWWHDTVGNKPNSFNVTYQELAGEVQSLTLVWLIVKA